MPFTLQAMPAPGWFLRLFDRYFFVAIVLAWWYIGTMSESITRRQAYTTKINPHHAKALDLILKGASMTDDEAEGLRQLAKTENFLFATKDTEPQLMDTAIVVGNPEAVKILAEGARFPVPNTLVPLPRYTMITGEDKLPTGQVLETAGYIEAIKNPFLKMAMRGALAHARPYGNLPQQVRRIPSLDFAVA
jgi:hypothetical protein